MITYQLQSNFYKSFKYTQRFNSHFNLFLTFLFYQECYFIKVIAISKKLILITLTIIIILLITQINKVIVTITHLCVQHLFIFFSNI